MIREMNENDQDIFYKLTNLFYKSDSVLADIPNDFHIKTFKEIMRSSDYLNGYILLKDNKPAGYALTSKYYSHEAGGITLFVDELFVLKEYRSQGLAKEFFQYINDNLDDTVVRLRLEVESDNNGAIKLYDNEGFSFLNYAQMIKNI